MTFLLRFFCGVGSYGEVYRGDWHGTVSSIFVKFCFLFSYLFEIYNTYLKCKRFVSHILLHRNLNLLDHDMPPGE